VSPSHEVALLDALDSPIALVANDWRIVRTNSAWTLALNLGAARIIGSSLWTCCPLLTKAPAPEMLRATAGDGGTRRFDLVDEHARQFGVRVTGAGRGQILIELSPPYDSARTLGGILLDHTEQGGASLRTLARHIAGLSDAATLLRTLCEVAEGQCSADGAGVITATGGDAQVVVAVGAFAPAHGKHFSLAGSLAEEAIRSQGTVSLDDFSGSARPLTRAAPALSLGPVLLAPLIAHENVLGVLTVVRGPHGHRFTDLETQHLRVLADYAALALWKSELLEKAQSADHAKSRFLATVSHELRTPLTALTGYEELLVDEVLGPLTEAQADVVERMRSVTHHLTVMIEELLSFSSIETGREKVRSSEFLAADLMRATAALIEPQARQKRLTVVCDVPDEPIRMSSDIDKIRQILVNLAGNAVKFTDAGEVRLTVARDGEHVRYSVHDSGIGIAPEDVARLFQPFSQLDAGLTRRHGGTGLGLYISQRLATLLGGTIEVSSAPGRGSTFSLNLPTFI
jgi:signal transduction histidine kinase